MPQTQNQRRQRYVREKPASSFKITERDLEIVRFVYRHRFLTADLITALTGGSRQGVSRRLNLLFHGGWLDRPRSQLLMPERLDSRCNHAMIYALGNRGAKHLSVELDLPLSTVNWTAKNNELKSGFFLEHTLMVARFMVMIRLACKLMTGIEFISQEEIISKRKELIDTNDKELGFQVQLKLRKGQRKPFIISVVPDAAFGFRFLDQPKEKYFFFEADRATMPIRRASLLRSSFYKKMLGYHAVWEKRILGKTFHFKDVRVLTMTTSNERIENMIEVGREMDPRKKGLGMFLFTTQDLLSLEHPEKVFQEIWLSGNGKKCSLLD
jgi:hypothetical protein